MERKSVKTRRVYFTALNHLVTIIQEKYPTYDSDSIIDAMLEKKTDVYEFLDNFIAYVQSVKKGITANTIGVYAWGLRSYFSYYDIDIIPFKFKRKVFLPKTPREDEQALDASDIRKILLSCSNRRCKAYLLILASGGMRTIEALAIRNKDIDFNSSPTKIHLRKEYSKIKVGRDIYISDEATEYLKQWLDFKYNNPDRPREKREDGLIFTIYETATTPELLYQRLVREFHRVLKSVKLDERKEDGILGRRKITLHSFRRHAKTVISDQVNTDYSEYFIGHSSSPYWTKKEAEKREIYKNKIMRYLTFLDYTQFEAADKLAATELTNAKNQIVILNQQIERMKEQHAQTDNMRDQSALLVSAQLQELTQKYEDMSNQFKEWKKDQSRSD